jgi:hypothetical protein
MPGTGCTSNFDCRVNDCPDACVGGTTPGASCSTDADCHDGTCVGGAEPGTTCKNDADCLDLGSCVSGSTPGAACSSDADCPALYASKDDAAFLAVWPQLEGACDPDVPHTLTTQWMWKPDGYAVWVTQKGDVYPPTDKLARHIHDLTQDIQAIDPVKSAVNGEGEILPQANGNYVDPSDRNLRPNVLKGSFYLNLSPQNAAYGNYIYYTELFLGNDRAPTDFVRINCYPEAQGPYQQLIPTDEQVHASFAFGLMSIMDNNNDPCDVDMGRKPSAWRAFVYDGKTWVRLKGPAFYLPVPDDWDFRPNKGFNRFEFYIGTENIEIRLYNDRAGEVCELADLGWAVPPPSSKQCECSLLETGECDSVDGACVDNKCVGGMKDGQDCTGDADCAASDLCVAGADAHAQCDLYDFFCEANLCDGGPRDELACTEDADCQGMACIGGGSDGEPCTTDDDCAGYPCLDDTQCRDSMDCSGYFVVLVPRQYTGPFSKIAMGAGKGVDRTSTVACELVGWPPAMKCNGGPNSGNACTSNDDCPSSLGQCVSNSCQGGANHNNACNSDADCPDFEECMDAISYNDMTVEEVILYDGVLETAEGACCEQTLPGQGTCTLVSSEIECNDTWMGLLTTCNDCVYDCYADPFADADADGDVDQNDFALLQRCYSGSGGGILPDGGCHCFNVVGDSLGTQPDNDVDQTDYIVFESCASGPNIPANSACDD